MIYFSHSNNSINPTSYVLILTATATSEGYLKATSSNLGKNPPGLLNMKIQGCAVIYANIATDRDINNVLVKAEDL